MSNTADREIVIARIIDAPREKVWKAWTEPEHLIKWWGPDGFTNTFYEIDIRPGGVWRFMMHGPDGTDYPNKIVFKELIKPEKIVWDHSGDGDVHDHVFQGIATFEDLGRGKTKVTLTSVHRTKEECDAVKGFATEGGNQTLGRLAAHVATL